jgi:hypothetical protein
MATSLNYNSLIVEQAGQKFAVPINPPMKQITAEEYSALTQAQQDNGYMWLVEKGGMGSDPGSGSGSGSGSNFGSGSDSGSGIGYQNIIDIIGIPHFIAAGETAGAFPVWAITTYYYQGNEYTYQDILSRVWIHSPTGEYGNMWSGCGVRDDDYHLTVVDAGGTGLQVEKAHHPQVGPGIQLYAATTGTAILRITIDEDISHSGYTKDFNIKVMSASDIPRFELELELEESNSSLYDIIRVNWTRSTNNDDYVSWYSGDYLHYATQFIHFKAYDITAKPNGEPSDWIMLYQCSFCYERR